MGEKEQLVKFIEKLEPLLNKDFTTEDVNTIEDAVEHFYSIVKTVNRAKVQSNALQLLGNDAYKITTGIESLSDFKYAFHSICQLSTEFFNSSGDPMMLIAYLGILAEYYITKDITKED